MLKNIDPVLNADIIHALCLMGHGDEIAIVDTHYRADKVARQTTYGNLLRMEAVDTARAIRAVLSVIDVDPDVPHPIERLRVDDKPSAFQLVNQQETQTVVNDMMGSDFYIPALSIKEFYERAKKSYVIIVTGETRRYGCYIITKGINATPDQPATQNNARLQDYYWPTELGRPEAVRRSKPPTSF